MRFGNAALRNARAAARSGRTVLTEEAERAVDGLLAGPLPEAFARSLVRHRVVQRVVAESLEESGLAESGRDPLELAVERAVGTPAFRRALLDVLSSDEVRHALTHQTAGYGAELAVSLREQAGGADDFAAAPRARDARFGGLATRGVALVVDSLLAYLVFLVLGASVFLVVSIAGTIRPEWLAGAIAGAGWFAVVAIYFVGFWSGAGQTPGMRLMGLRVVTGSDKRPGVLRSLVRLVGLILAIIPMFAGFLPVLFDRRRRGLQDFLAGTVVTIESSRSGDAAAPAGGDTA